MERLRAALRDIRTRIEQKANDAGVSVSLVASTDAGSGLRQQLVRLSIRRQVCRAVHTAGFIITLKAIMEYSNFQS